ncbi:helix-turn-helix transcriptional regulator [Streptomyces sp. LP05-1]|uniref:Helix-turn-helix transcriptional regulator n=1 Tax=Streptomyces pyxinae TaxID=2970734 RepID=A0ABT2CI18_9ACTN|nr:helix-turn-helix transcriptional regulator [Streptomyces sp. LP05-1]MCS0637041.1 helix-turn-helix transcriptional regulator [Streptomyces sp. LP05-1]
MPDDESQPDLTPLQSFGLDVQQVRLARKLTMKQLGKVAGYSESYVSKVEAGKMVPSEQFAVGCDRAFGTGTLFLRQLRRALLSDHPSWFAPYIQLELRATEILDYSTMFIMGMLQTVEYARATLRAYHPREARAVLEERVAARIRRREVMDRPYPPLLWVVLHETCLRTVVGDRQVMARQMERLIKEAENPHVTLQVLPFGAGTPVTGTAFTLLVFDNGPTVVHAESPQGGRLYEDPKTTKNATGVYHRLRADALSPDLSLTRIKDMYKEYAA